MKKIYLLICSIICLGIVPTIAQVTALLDFNQTDGEAPYGSLYYDGTFLYGMTTLGGANDSGVIFRIKPNGTGDTVLYDFNRNGYEPHGSLISDGTFFYGITTLGGINNEGTIFKIKPNGTGYVKLLDFNGANGKYPNGSLISDGTFLYGMTPQGGANDSGVIFKIKPDGTGYLKLLDCTLLKGSSPMSDLYYDGTFLYGMAQGGTGVLGPGVIFRIKPNGTGDTVLLNFNYTNGAGTNGSLISDGTFLYGMTTGGGVTTTGNIFKIKPNGTGYTDLHDFYDTIPEGNYPYGSLYYDGTFLYGMTSIGGTLDYGIIFKIKPNGTGYSILYSFDGISGANPYGSLISDGTFLYGLAYGNGTNAKWGSIFKINPTALGISEVNAKPTFNIYPNPTNGVFNLVVTGCDNLQDNNIDIYNVMGEKVYSSTLRGQISIINLNAANGVYFLRLKTIQGITNEKLIINK